IRTDLVGAVRATCLFLLRNHGLHRFCRARSAEPQQLAPATLRLDRRRGGKRRTVVVEAADQPVFGNSNTSDSKLANGTTVVSRKSVAIPIGCCCSCLHLIVIDDIECKLQCFELTEDFAYCLDRRRRLVGGG